MEYEIKDHNQVKPFTMSNIEESIQLARLQQVVNASALYERKQNQKALKVLTVAAYILFVSMAAIILSFYYVFIWDPSARPVGPRSATNCDIPMKIVIPESLAIELANSSEISAEAFYNKILNRYQRMEKHRKLGRKSSRRKSSRKLVTIAEEPKIIVRKLIQPDDSSERNSTTSEPIVRQSEEETGKNDDDLDKIITKEYDSYMDDEDLQKEYDETESSGFNDRLLLLKMKLNETYNYEDQEEGNK